MQKFLLNQKEKEADLKINKIMYYSNSTMINFFFRTISLSEPCITFDCCTFDNQNYISLENETILTYTTT
jgi:hypothetical protein